MLVFKQLLARSSINIYWIFYKYNRFDTIAVSLIFLLRTYFVYLCSDAPYSLYYFAKQPVQQCHHEHKISLKIKSFEQIIRINKLNCLRNFFGQFIRKLLLSRINQIYYWISFASYFYITINKTKWNKSLRLLKFLIKLWAWINCRFCWCFFLHLRLFMKYCLR